MKLIQLKKQKLNFNGEGGAIFRLWEDPGEQNNLISDSSLEWVKTEAYEWMAKELKGSRLPVHGSDNERHSKFYKTSLLPVAFLGPKKPNPAYLIFE